MGPRPPDFDEHLIQQSPTFIRWNQLQPGEKLRYACREFIKGQGDDAERLMRRIMIARRNNIRDHQTLKRARQIAVKPNSDNHNMEEHDPKIGRVDHSEGGGGAVATIHHPVPVPTPTTRKRRPSTMFCDNEVVREIDVPAVEATRSYQAWMTLPDGAEFVYNQKYTKGKDGHDWLLRKNIWRRMRYRRENKKMVEQMRQTHPPPPQPDHLHHIHHQILAPPQDHHHMAEAVNHSTTHHARVSVASQIVDQALLSMPTDPTPINTPATVTAAMTTSDAPNEVVVVKQAPPPQDTTEDDSFEVSAAVEAAVAVAESYVKSPYNVVHNPLEAAHANTAALDAAARLAAAAASSNVGDATTSQLEDDAVAAVAAAADRTPPQATYTTGPTENSTLVI